MTIDYATLLLAPIILVVGIVFAAAVCIVALCRADRADVVAVVRALPELVAEFRRRHRRR